MNEASRQMSLSLEQCSGALAEWTVGQHAERDPTLPDRYGPAWRRSWVAEVATRVRHLAQSVAVRRPELFEQFVVWSSQAHTARSIGGEDMMRSLDALGEVIAAELPETTAREVMPHIERASARLREPIDEPASTISPAAPHGELVLRYLEAALSGRRDEAIRIVASAAQSGVPVRDLYASVLHPALTEIGRLWHLGELSIADEHYATATTEMTMTVLRAHFDRVEPNGRRVVATAVGGDLHALGIRMVSDHFEMAGWDAIFLGANTPLPDVLLCLHDREAHLLAASVASPLSLRALGELVDAVRGEAALDGIKVIVGGGPLAVMPDLWRELGADGCATSAAKAVELAETLMSDASPPPAPPAEPPAGAL